MAFRALDGWLRRRMDIPEDAPMPTPEDVRHWQFARIGEVVAYARANSPFYRERLADLPHFDGVAFPVDYVALENLPRMSADDLRAAPERLLCVSQDEVARVVTLESSGTTGEPKRLFFTAEDLERTTDFFADGMRFLAGPGDAVLILLPGERPGGVARMLCEAVGRFGAHGLAHGPVEDPDATVRRMLEEGVRCIVGSPAQVNTLARAWAARGLPRDCVRSVLLCWDVVPEAVAANLRAAFGCRVLRHWGMVETGLGGAVECADGSGMHLREADLFVEITDPKTGRSVPPGETGEIVVTTLSRRAMPLIRYRTGDLARLLPEPCRCGSPLRLLGPVFGRLDDVSEFSLAALGEALYAVEGVADFTAELKPRKAAGEWDERGEPATLRLRLSIRPELAMADRGRIDFLTAGGFSPGMGVAPGGMVFDEPFCASRDDGADRRGVNAVIEAVLRAASGLPAVRSRLIAGTLRLEAEIVGRGGPAKSGLAKRRLHQHEPDDIHEKIDRRTV